MNKQQLYIQSVLTRFRKSGQGGGIVVTGEVGAGKSHLVEQVLSGDRREDFPVSRGRCREDEAYAPFVDMLIELLSCNPKAIPAAAMPRVLAQVPSLAVYLGQAQTAAGTGHSRQDQLLFFGMMIAVLGDRVLIIDDAHRIDQASLSLLNFLLKRSGVFALLLARDEGTLSSLAGLESVRVSPLSEAETADLIADVLGGGVVPVSLIGSVMKRSHGNPTFVRAMVGYLRDCGAVTATADGWDYDEAKDVRVAPQMKDLLEGRFAGLQSTHRRALAVAGLMGDDFTAPVLADVVGEYQAETAINAAEAAGIVVKEVEHYYFSPLEAGRLLAESLNSVERERLHRLIAEVMAARPYPEEQAARIADHFEQGQDVAKAALWWLAAARRAMNVNTLRVAAQYANRAKALRESMVVNDLLGDIYRQQGDAEKAIQCYQAAQQQAMAAERPDERARILNSLALTYWLYDRNEEAQSVVGMVMAMDGVPAAERAAAESHLAMIYWQLGWLQQGKAVCESALKGIKKQNNPGVLAGALNRMGLICLSLGELEWAQRAFEAALNYRKRLGDLWGYAFVLNNLAKLDIERAEYLSAFGRLEEAEKIFTDLESRDGLMVVHTNQGRAHIRAGNAEIAMPFLKKALWLALEIGKKQAYGMADIQLLLAEVHLAAGRLAEAEECIEAGLKLAQAGGNREYIGIGYGLRARLLKKQGDDVAAGFAHGQAVDLLLDIGAAPALGRVRES